MLADREDARLTLYLRDAGKLHAVPANARVVEADVLDAPRLAAALEGQDVVYANLSGDVDEPATAIVSAMEAAGIRKLVFVTSLGIYDEVPDKFGDWNRREIGAYLPPYRRAADTIEASSLFYAILRPAWLTDADEVDYEVTTKGESFRGTEVARKSVAALVVDLIVGQRPFLRDNLGINKPGTDGVQPVFIRSP